MRLPPPPEPDGPARPTGAALLSTEDLEAIRDGLLERLDQLDVQRAAAEPPTRRSSPSRAGARIRWVGA